MSGNTYSTIRSSASKTRSMSSTQNRGLQSFEKTPYSILKSRSATNNSSMNSSLERSRLPTVKSATAQLGSTAKATSTKINSSVKDLRTTANDSVKSIEKTVTPVIKTVTEPVVKTATTISNSIEKTVTETIKTIENSPITKRFLGLFVLPIQKHGASIITLMVIMFGVILIYKEMNKGKPVEIEKKHMIGKIVYETFNPLQSSPVEGFEGRQEMESQTTKPFKRKNKKSRKATSSKSKENFTNKNMEKTTCPKLNKNTIKNFCKNYDSDKVSDNCLEDRCKELKGNCKKSSCCVEKNVCTEGFTLMGGNKLGGDSDIKYYSKM